MQISSTADPFWKRLQEGLAQNSMQVAAQLARVFKADAAEDFVHAVPSSIVLAMIKGLASEKYSRLLQSCVLKALLQLVRLLVAAGDSANCLPTPSKVWPVSPWLHHSSASSLPVSVNHTPSHRIISCEHMPQMWPHGIMCVGLGVREVQSVGTQCRVVYAELVWTWPGDHCRAPESMSEWSI